MTMIIKDIDLNLWSTQKYEGTTKQGKPYLFYKGKFIDSEGDNFDLKIGNNIVSDTVQIQKIMLLKNKPVTVDISLFPSGFALKATVVKIDI
jgi:hypothetical protein